MRLLALLAAGLLAGTLQAEEKKGEKKVKDEESILGVWKVEKYDVGLPDTERTDRATKMVMTFTKGGKLTMSFNGADVEMVYKLDSTAKPKAIDMTRDGITVPAVYELDGDTLAICSQAGAKEGQKFVRPEGMKADAKKDVTLMTLKRVKVEPKKDK